ncbi:MAG: DUF393 domain-containing protein [Oxalobacteraceae bacterium]|nr:DUF393 domain-containing protein [Oxalobacteraceae bacterium]
MRPLMIFDGDCAFCTTSANFMRRRIRPRCDIEPWQHTDIEAFGLTATECTTAVQFVTADRRVYSGSRSNCCTSAYSSGIFRNSSLVVA